MDEEFSAGKLHKYTHLSHYEIAPHEMQSFIDLDTH